VAGCGAGPISRSVVRASLPRRRTRRTGSSAAGGATGSAWSSSARSRLSRSSGRRCRPAARPPRRGPRTASTNPPRPVPRATRRVPAHVARRRPTGSTACGTTASLSPSRARCRSFDSDPVLAAAYARHPDGFVRKHPRTGRPNDAAGSTCRTRLAGTVTAVSGTSVPGPLARWIGPLSRVPASTDAGSPLTYSMCSGRCRSTPPGGVGSVKQWTDAHLVLTTGPTTRAPVGGRASLGTSRRHARSQPTHRPVVGSPWFSHIVSSS
jgi:hypothetical protein